MRCPAQAGAHRAAVQHEAGRSRDRDDLGDGHRPQVARRVVHDVSLLAGSLALYGLALGERYEFRPPRGVTRRCLPGGISLRGDRSPEGATGPAGVRCQAMMRKWSGHRYSRRRPRPECAGHGPPPALASSGMGGWLPVSRDPARLGIQASGPARSARTRLDCQNSSHVKTCSSWVARKAGAAADSPPQGCNQFIARDLFLGARHGQKARDPRPGQARRRKPHRGRRAGPAARPDPLTPHPGRPGSTFG